MNTDFRYSNVRYNSSKEQNIKEAVEYILGKNYGQVVSFKDLGKILQYNIDDEIEFKRFKNAMNRIKNFLINYGYILKIISNVGYYILKPKQISGYCFHTYIRRTENLLNKSELILNHVDIDELSADRKIEHAEVKKLNLDLTEATESTILDSVYMKNKSYYDNLDD